jgi:hypothetical protein
MPDDHRVWDVPTMRSHAPKWNALSASTSSCSNSSTVIDLALPFSALEMKTNAWILDLD